MNQINQKISEKIQALFACREQGRTIEQEIVQLKNDFISQKISEGWKKMVMVGDDPEGVKDNPIRVIIVHPDVDTKGWEHIVPIFTQWDITMEKTEPFWEWVETIPSGMVEDFSFEG